MMYNCFTHTIFWLLRFFQWVKMLALSLLHNWIAYFLSCRRVLEPYNRSVFCICPWNGLASHSEKIVVLLDSSCSQDSLFPPSTPSPPLCLWVERKNKTRASARNVCGCEWFAWQCKLTKMASRLLENEKNKTVLENCYKICKQLLYRYWWNTRIFPFTKKSYLHHAQWRYYFYLSCVRILVSPWLLTLLANYNRTSHSGVQPVLLKFHQCKWNKQNITWPLGDTNFIFLCWKYLSWVRVISLISLLISLSM